MVGVILNGGGRLSNQTIMRKKTETFENQRNFVMCVMSSTVALNFIEDAEKL